MGKTRAPLICRDGSRLPALEKPVVAALGSFDGVHRGHQALITRMQRAREHLRTPGGGRGTLVIISFYPHPATIVRGGKSVPLLTTLNQKRDVLGGVGVDLLFLQHFTQQFSKISAEAFIRQLLVNTLGVDYIVLGPDARVGFERKGDAEFILRALKEVGRGGEIVSFLEVEGERVSSGAIRACLMKGDVEHAGDLLGRPFALVGRVIHGAGRGQKIGIPTANLSVSPQALLPELGVYATTATINGQSFPAVTNVGRRPTFGADGGVSVETHLLSPPEASLYGERMEINFTQRIRAEQKFERVEDLVTQINKDIQTAKALHGLPL